MICLTVHQGSATTRHPFVGDQLRVGSAPDNDVVIASSFVSRHHAVLGFVEGLVEVQDLGSRNGTRLDGRLVRFERRLPPVLLTLGADVALEVTQEDTGELLLAPEVGIAPATPPGTPAEARETTPDGPPAGSAHGAELLAALRRHGLTAGALPDLMAIALRACRGSSALLARLPGDPDAEPLVEQAQGLLRPEPSQWSEVRERLADGRDHGWLVTGRVPLGFAAARSDGDAMRVLLVDGEPATDLGAAADALALLAPAGTPDAGRPAAPRILDLGRLGHVAPRSAAMRLLHERMAGALASDLPVLLTGPTGSGKEVHARAIHASSTRSAGPFQAVNMAALPETLLESMLFGTEEGAATGVRRQVGLLREAHGGTFFLDEVGEMSAALQARLLRVIDRREILPIGATRPVRIDVRFIAATNRDLHDAVRRGQFREDLLFRLSGHVFTLPSLEDHPEDIAAHVTAFVEAESRRAGKTIPGVSVRALEALVAHDWPGNVRELETLVRRLVHETPDGQPIRASQLPEGLQRPASPAAGRLNARLERVRRELVLEALAACESRRAAARWLGISRGGLRILMERLGIDD